MSNRDKFEAAEEFDNGLRQALFGGLIPDEFIGRKAWETTMYCAGQQYGHKIKDDYREAMNVALEKCGHEQMGLVKLVTSVRPVHPLDTGECDECGGSGVIQGAGGPLDSEPPEWKCNKCLGEGVIEIE